MWPDVNNDDMSQLIGHITTTISYDQSCSAEGSCSALSALVSIRALSTRVGCTAGVRQGDLGASGHPKIVGLFQSKKHPACGLRQRQGQFVLGFPKHLYCDIEVKRKTLGHCE
jgi:hypothetical protein